MKKIFETQVATLETQAKTINAQAQTLHTQTKIIELLTQQKELDALEIENLNRKIEEKDLRINQLEKYFDKLGYSLPNIDALASQVLGSAAMKLITPGVDTDKLKNDLSFVDERQRNQVVSLAQNIIKGR